MITKSNYLSEAPKYASKFPEALKEGHELILMLKDEGLDVSEKTGDKGIDEAVDLQISKLNEWIKANEVKDDKPKVTKKEEKQWSLSDYKLFKKFTPLHQQKILTNLVNSRSEDSVIEGRAMIEGIEKMLQKLPQKQTSDDDKKVYIKYFAGGASYWFVKEYLPEDDVFYGFAILNGWHDSSEWGYISREELVNSNKTELDFYFEPANLDKILYKIAPDYYPNPNTPEPKKKPSPTRKAGATRNKFSSAKKPKFGVGEFVKYTTGDLEIETWYGKIDRVVNLKTEFAYRINAYTRHNGKVVLQKEKNNEVYEARLRKTTPEQFLKLDKEFRNKTTSATKAEPTPKDFTPKTPAAKPKQTAATKKKATANRKKTAPKPKTIIKKVVKEVPPPKAPVQVTKLSAELQIIKNILALNGKKRTVVYISRLKEQAERAIAYGALHHAADVQEGIRILNKILAKAEEDKSTHMIVTFKEDTISDLKSTLSKAKVRIQVQYLAGVKKKEQEERAARQRLTPSLSKGEGVGTVNTPRLTPEDMGTEPVEYKNLQTQTDNIPIAIGKPSTVNRKAPSNKNAPAHLQSLIKKSSDLGTDYEAEYFEIPNKDMAMFLGKVERKPFHSVVMTLDAPEGAGKTRACFQVAKAFAEANYKVLFVTLEEHGESSLFTDKRDDYWDAQDQKRIDVISELPKGVETLVELSELYDVIITDSWQKVDDGDAKLDDYRKSVDGKLLVIIFQRTTDNKMRGGSKSKFDADMVGKLYKSPDGDYKKNYVYWDKNRYNKHNMVFLITEGIALNRETFVSEPSESTKK